MPLRGTWRMLVNAALCGKAMSKHRQKLEKMVFVYHSDSGEWEAWHLQFNRGTKQNKPVKFFASKEWFTGKKGTSFSGTRWDFANDQAAEEWFVAQIQGEGGIVREAHPSLTKELAALGYKPHNSSLNRDSQ